MSANKMLLFSCTQTLLRNAQILQLAPSLLSSHLLVLVNIGFSFSKIIDISSIHLISPSFFYSRFTFSFFLSFIALFLFLTLSISISLSFSLSLSIDLPLTLSLFVSLSLSLAIFLSLSLSLLFPLALFFSQK